MLPSFESAQTGSDCFTTSRGHYKFEQLPCNQGGQGGLFLPWSSSSSSSKVLNISEERRWRNPESLTTRPSELLSARRTSGRWRRKSPCGTKTAPNKPRSPGKSVYLLLLPRYENFCAIAWSYLWERDKGPERGGHLSLRSHLIASAAIASRGCSSEPRHSMRLLGMRCI